MTTCYNCGGTNGAHDPACPAVKNATPPAMNTASPTDKPLSQADAVAYWHELNGTKPSSVVLAALAAPAGQGSAALDSQRWSKEADMIESWSGSATSGEESAFQAYLTGAGKSPDIPHHRDEWAAWQARATLAAKAEQSPKWRCFHCHESFDDAEKAAQHFGFSERETPACKIDEAHLRELEHELKRYREEDTDLHRQIAGEQSRRAVAERRAEEAGYARGLAGAHLIDPAESAEQPNTAGAAKGGITQAQSDAIIRAANRLGALGYTGISADLREAFAAPVAERAAAPASVPEGYALVPIESSNKMDSDGHDALLACGLNAEQIDAERCWNAMISAAPEVAQPAAQGGMREALYRLRNECDLAGLRSQAGFDCWLNIADKALATPAPTAGEPSACPTCPKETPYGSAICGKCVEAGESSATERDAARYRHIRDTRFNGYDLRGQANIGKWHVSRKMRPGEGAYYFGERLDAAVDEDIVAAHIKATAEKDGAA